MRAAALPLAEELELYFASEAVELSVLAGHEQTDGEKPGRKAVAALHVRMQLVDGKSADVNALHLYKMADEGNPRRE